MIISYKIEEKTKELAIEKIKREFHLEEKDFYITKETNSSGIFKGSKMELEIIKKEDIFHYIEQYINTVKENLNMNIQMTLTEKEHCLFIRLTSDNNALLIGKNGKNVNALQHLLQQSIKRQTSFPIKIFMDVEDYKYNKEKKLKKEIEKIAKEVLETKIDVNLDPMNSYDRRLVHTIISTFENLKSISKGEEPNRYIQISYMEK